MTAAEPTRGGRSLGGTVRTWLELVRFSHTIFALPFAVMALFLATPGRWPEPTVTVLVLVCMVAARTAAMAYNRLVDRDIDAENPRTRSRHLPAGLIGSREVLALIVLSSAVFMGGAFLLNRLAFVCSLPVLAVLLGYSHTKRFFSGTHFVLGLALGLAPLGVWIAVRGVIDASVAVPALLGGAVLLWVAGFDVIYSCQDVGFDRRAGLHSVPARLGVPRALWLARACHVGMLALLVLLGRSAELGAIYWCGAAVTALLLLWEHRLVRAEDLSRVDMAFFTVNGGISVLLSVFTIVEVMR